MILLDVDEWKHTGITIHAPPPKFYHILEFPCLGYFWNKNKGMVDSVICHNLNEYIRNVPSESSLGGENPELLRRLEKEGYLGNGKAEEIINSYNYFTSFKDPFEYFEAWFKWYSNPN